MKKCLSAASAVLSAVMLVSPVPSAFAAQVADDSKVSAAVTGGGSKTAVRISDFEDLESGEEYGYLKL